MKLCVKFQQIENEDRYIFLSNSDDDNDEVEESLNSRPFVFHPPTLQENTDDEDTDEDDIDEDDTDEDRDEVDIELQTFMEAMFTDVFALSSSSSSSTSQEIDG